MVSFPSLDSVIPHPPPRLALEGVFAFSQVMGEGSSAGPRGPKPCSDFAARSTELSENTDEREAGGGLQTGRNNPRGRSFGRGQAAGHRGDILKGEAEGI